MLKFSNQQIPPMGWRRWVRCDSAHPRDDHCGRLGGLRWHLALPPNTTHYANGVRQKSIWGGWVRATGTLSCSRGSREERCLRSAAI